VEKATHQLWWFVLSRSPRLRRGDHVELFEKLEGEVLEQRSVSVSTTSNNESTEGSSCRVAELVYLSVHSALWCATRSTTPSKPAYSSVVDCMSASLKRTPPPPIASKPPTNWSTVDTETPAALVPETAILRDSPVIVMYRPARFIPDNLLVDI
jgi:hypothetical protein